MKALQFTNVKPSPRASKFISVQFIPRLGFFDLNALLRVHPPQISLNLFSAGRPRNEEQGIDLHRLYNTDELPHY